MKRDMDAIRRVVLALSQSDGPISSVEGLDDLQFRLHAALLIESGLATGAQAKSSAPPGVPAQVMLFRLTWEGFDFADQVRDDTLWKKAQEHVLKPSASFAFSVLTEYLRAEIRRRIPGLSE